MTRKEMEDFKKHRHRHLKFKVAFNPFGQSSWKIWMRMWDSSIGNMRYTDFFRSERFKDTSGRLTGNSGNSPHAAHICRINRWSTQLEWTPSMHAAESTIPGHVFERRLVFLTCNYYWNTMFFLRSLHFFTSLYLWAISAIRSLILCK